jgi:hypothetical protein
MSRHLKLFCLIALVLSVSSRGALAITVPLNFSGPEQDFDATFDLTASLFASGTGQVFNPLSKAVENFSTTPPLTHASNSKSGPVSFSGTGKSDSSLNPTMEIVDNHVTKFNNLLVDLFDGGAVPLEIGTMNVTTNSNVSLLKNLTVDASADITDIAFEQTGAGSFIPTGPGTGTFAIPGRAIATYENFQAVLADLITIPFVFSGDGIGKTSILLTGTYKVTGPPGNTRVEFDGDGHYEFVLFSTTGQPDEFEFSADTPLALTISALVNIGLTTGYDVRFHMEQSGIIVPEPGSVTLLFIGLTVLSSGVVYRRHRQHQNAARALVQG